MNIADFADATPALEDLVSIGSDGVNLIGAQCASCRTFFFPCYHEQHRPGCERKEVTKLLLDREGVLRSYTVQHYQAPPPFRTEGSIAPYVIGLVEFNDAIQIAGLVIGTDANQLSTGMRMSTSLFKLYKAEDGTAVVTWAFEPAGAPK